MNKKSKNLPANNCENCGTIDDLDYYQHIFDGIVLCKDCADLTPKDISKRGSKVNWVSVDGSYYPPDIAVTVDIDVNKEDFD